RELENCMESAVVIMDEAMIGPHDLPLPERPLSLDSTTERPPESSGGRILTLAEMERRHIERVLAHVGGNQTAAAKLLGIGRNTLGRKLKAYEE
ncbi:MAG: sigma-54-dependent Fis family transcriptional regulator, partial [Myxococcales bacterium]|nr:sigma-54-dependent Fis family transcriptional regulator [Myxococcales bacterium]